MKYFFCFLLIVLPGIFFGQSPYILPGTLSDEIADRWDILYDFDHKVFASQRNISRKELSQRAYKVNSISSLSPHDKFDLQYILEDNNDFNSLWTEYGLNLDIPERDKVYDSAGVFYHLDTYKTDESSTFSRYRRDGLFGHFYKNDANFFEINSDNFQLRANPILNLRYGEAFDDPNIIFQNTRGVEIRGLIDNNIYFYSNILENQARFNNYREARISNFKTIGGQGFYKSYNSGVIENLRGYDFLNAQAYVGMNVTKSVAIELGHGKHFIGNGIRSMLLSDYSNNYFYLKFNTRVWKLHYQNVFAELAPVTTKLNPGNTTLPKKYMANHYLAFRPNQSLELGIFETIVFSREDRFEFQYLNPIILYRTVEQFLDSPDNVLIGLNGKWNIKNRFQLYGQLMLDEFKLGELTEGSGWWANKYGIQLGGKYINAFGLDHLDLQVEYNSARPFTYAHRDSLSIFPELSTASYSHHSQPLAHPLGSNFREVLFNFRYRLGQKIFVNGRIISARYGQDPENKNLGSNILKVTESREEDYGHFIGQGIRTNMMSLGLDVSYMLFHNYFIDFNLLYRDADADKDELDINTLYIGGGFRVNLGNIVFDY